MIGLALGLLWSPAMTKPLMTMAMAIWAMAAVTGCGGASGEPTGAAGAAPSGTTPVDTTAGSADVAVCQRACSTLVGCGVEYDATCAASCLQQPLFLDCARTATDCNGLALCAFRVDSTVTCGSPTAGYPAGAEACGTAATCQGLCAATSQPASCRCACNAQTAPSNAINLLINDQCALAKCPVDCGATGSGPACLSCFQAHCQAESAQCVAAVPAPTSTGTTPQGTPSAAPAQVKLPTQPTDEVAPAGTLDPQLVGSWPVTGVQVYWDGTGVVDWTASDPLHAQLASVPLALAADGTFSFGPVTGTWTVIPFLAADKALWGTGGRGPDGYAREIVLAVNGKVYTRGPIEDPSPPATAPWGLNIAFRVQSPQPGNVLVMFERPSMNTDGGKK